MYSTCSVNVEENEEVVLLALNSKFHNFDLVSIEKKLPGWTNYGSNHFKFGSKCVYSLPESDFTNGFFVAVFERKTSYSKDETESFSEGGHAIDQESGFKRKNSYSKDKTKSFTKGGYGIDQASVFERENSFSKDKTESLTEGDYEIGQESQKDTTKKRKHPKMHIETTGKTRLEEINLSKKRSLSETKSYSDNNSYSYKKIKNDNKTSPAVPNNILKNKPQQQVSGTQQAGTNINKTSKKPTKSHKKRLRRIKMKSMLSHNTDKDKKKDKVVQNSNKKVKNKNVNDKSGKLLENNMKVNDETKNKLSKSKIRQLRLKKLKLKAKLVQSEGETLGNDVKRLYSENKKKTKRITKSEENVTTEKTHTATVSPIDNSQDPVIDSAKKPKPHKKKHKKNKLDLNEIPC